jgi:isocitrate lyase
VPTKVLEEWVDAWRQQNDFTEKLRAELRPHVPGSELLELSLKSISGEKLLNVVFSPVQDRRGRKILSLRDQNTASALRRRRLMTLAQLFLIHRYKADSLHYLTPNEDNEAQTRSMKNLGIFSGVKSETNLIILADVDQVQVASLVASDSKARAELITRGRGALPRN